MNGDRSPEPQPRAGLTPVAREEVHLLDYIRVLCKRRWTMGTAFTVVVLAATVYTFTATPLYEGRARLLIESDAPNIVSFKEVIDEGQAKTDYYQTQYTILQSRALARRTLDRPMPQPLRRSQKDAPMAWVDFPPNLPRPGRPRVEG